MDLETKVAILGLHNPDYLKQIEIYVRQSRVEPKSTASLAGMKKLIAQYPDAVGIFMDTNLESSDSANPESSVHVYGLVGDRVESGEAVFLAVSHNSDVGKAAIEQGIPSDNVAHPRDNDKFKTYFLAGLKERA